MRLDFDDEWDLASAVGSRWAWCNIFYSEDLAILTIVNEVVNTVLIKKRRTLHFVENDGAIGLNLTEEGQACQIEREFVCSLRLLLDRFDVIKLNSVHFLK